VDILIDQSGDKRNEKLLSRLESALLQLETQMNDLTDYVRLESGRLELRQSMFIVQEILKRTVNDILPFARKKGLAVHCLDTTDDTLYISDPERIGQILNNLLSNAIKYTDQGEITIRTSSIVGPCNADLLTIEVADTGPGIPDDQIRPVFEPFSQINRTSTRKTGGMGMGLAIVQGLTTLLGGEIKADSRPGHGAVFRLTVPLDRANNSIKENTDFIISLPPAIRVLVVDDDEPARAAFRDLLDTLGIASDLARNAEEAMAKLCARRYDTVLLDIEMPGKDGHMLARELRSSAGPNRQVPIIVVSAHAVDGDKMPLYQSCLVKPVRLPPLRMALWRVLNKEVQNE
jgi:CheY-like chemotaxis protein/two-component sensor histidine kinase